MISQHCHNLRARQVVHGACDVITVCFLTQVISLNCGAPQIDTPAGLSALLSSEPSHSETLDSRTFRLQEFFCQLFLGSLMKQGFWQVFNWLPEKLFWINFCKFQKFLVQKIFGRKRIFINQILWQIFFLQNEFQTFFLSFFIVRGSSDTFDTLASFPTFHLMEKVGSYFFDLLDFFTKKRRKRLFWKFLCCVKTPVFDDLTLPAAVVPRSQGDDGERPESDYLCLLIHCQNSKQCQRHPKLQSSYPNTTKDHKGLM